MTTTPRLFFTTAGWTDFEDIYADFKRTGTATDFMCGQDGDRWAKIASAIRTRANHEGIEVWQATQRTKSGHLIKRHITARRG